MRPCRDRCPLVAQCLEAAKEDDPWHPVALTVRPPCSSGRGKKVDEYVYGATAWTVVMQPNEESQGAGREEEAERVLRGREPRKGRRKTLRFPEACEAWSGWGWEPEIELPGGVGGRL